MFGFGTNILKMNISKGIDEIYNCGKDTYWKDKVSKDKVSPQEATLVAAGILGVLRLDFGKKDFLAGQRLHTSALRTLVPIMKEAVKKIVNMETKMTKEDILKCIGIVIEELGKIKTKNIHKFTSSEFIGGKGEYNKQGDYRNSTSTYNTYKELAFWDTAVEKIPKEAKEIMTTYKVDGQTVSINEKALRKVIPMWQKSVLDSVVNKKKFCQKSKVALKKVTVDKESIDKERKLKF